MRGQIGTVSNTDISVHGTERAKYLLKRKLLE